MRNFASTLVKFSKLSHIQTTIWRPPKMAPPRTAGSAGPFVTPLLTSLNIKCAQEQKIPCIWKVANVVGLHKKDSKTDPLNSRPVSLTCILCKIYEKFISHHILEFVGDKIINDQHGFVDKKSCLSNLLETVDAVIDLLKSVCPVDVLYFDFCKAFGSVPHYRLLTKLENYGIKGST